MVTPTWFRAILLTLSLVTLSCAMPQGAGGRRSDAERVRLATAKSVAVFNGPASDLQARGIIKDLLLPALCGLLPGDAGQRSCEACKKLSPDARTCTKSEITSCIKKLVLEGKGCVTSCPDNYYPDSKNVVCLRSPTCSGSQYLSADKSKCVECSSLDPRATSCSKDAVKSCASNFTAVGTKCACTATQYQSADGSKCIDCKSFDMLAKTCTKDAVLTCSNGLTGTGKTCACTSSQYESTDANGGRSCVACNTLDPLALTCSADQVKTCTNGLTGSGKTCACTESQYESTDADGGRSCVACNTLDPLALTCSSDQVKTCSNGLTGSGKTCVCTESQYESEDQNGDRECVDCSSFDAFALTCKADKVDTCGSNFQAVGTKCVCAPNQYLSADNSQCLSCPLGAASCTADKVVDCRDNFDKAADEKSCVSRAVIRSLQYTRNFQGSGFNFVGGGSSSSANCAARAFAGGSALAYYYNNIDFCIGLSSLEGSDAGFNIPIYWREPGCPGSLGGEDCVPLYWVGDSCFTDEALIDECRYEPRY